MPWPKPTGQECLTSANIFFLLLIILFFSLKILCRIQGFWLLSPSQSLEVGTFKKESSTYGEKTDHKEHQKLEIKKIISLMYFNLLPTDFSVSAAFHKWHTAVVCEADLMWWQIHGGKNLDIHLQQLSEIQWEQPLHRSSGGKELSSLLKCSLFRWNHKFSDLVPMIHSDIAFPL